MLFFLFFMSARIDPRATVKLGKKGHNGVLKRVYWIIKILKSQIEELNILVGCTEGKMITRNLE